jgi:hypothetical protein
MASSPSHPHCAWLQVIYISLLTDDEEDGDPSVTNSPYEQERNEVVDRQEWGKEPAANGVAVNDSRSKMQVRSEPIARTGDASVCRPHVAPLPTSRKVEDTDSESDDFHHPGYHKFVSQHSRSCVTPTVCLIKGAPPSRGRLSPH